MTIAAYFLLIVIIPFIFAGIIIRVKSLAAGRKGLPLLQPLFDFIKLMKKGEVTSTTVTALFRFFPAIALSCVLFAGLLMPMCTGKSILSFEGDIILFIYILGLSRFFSILSAMDTGSSFEAMGAAREGGFSIFVEPALFVIIGTLALASGNTSFETLVVAAQGNATVMALVLSLLILSLFIIIIIEGCRVPVDDPNTHLELTMIHEVMILDNSGPSLAFITYASNLKMAILSSFIAALITPFFPDPVLKIAVYLFIVLFIAIVIGFIESVIARMRMTHVFQFILLVFSFSLIAFMVLAFAAAGVPGSGVPGNGVPPVLPPGVSP